MVVLLEGSPISTEELWSTGKVTIGLLVSSLTNDILPRLFSLAGQSALGRVLLLPTLFHLRMMEASVVLGFFNAAEMFWYPSPGLCLDTILSLSSMDNSFDLMTWFFILTCTVNCRTLYRQVCAFPNHVQSITFTTGGLQLSCRKISRMIN